MVKNPVFWREENLAPEWNPAEGNFQRIFESGGIQLCPISVNARERTLAPSRYPEETKSRSFMWGGERRFWGNPIIPWKRSSEKPQFFLQKFYNFGKSPPEPRVFGEKLRESEWNTLSYRKVCGLSRRTGGVFPEARSSKGVGWMVLWSVMIWLYPRRQGFVHNLWDKYLFCGSRRNVIEIT